MTEQRQHAIQVGEMFDSMTAQIAALQSENETLKRDLHETRGREQMLLHLNAKHSNTMVNLKAALKMQQASEHAIREAKIQPQLPLPPLDPLTADIAKRLAPPDPMRRMQIPQVVADRRPQRVA